MYVVWMPVMQFTAACDIIGKKLSDRVHELSSTDRYVHTGTLLARSGRRQPTRCVHHDGIGMERGKIDVLVPRVALSAAVRTKAENASVNWSTKTEVSQHHLVSQSSRVLRVCGVAFLSLFKATLLIVN